MRRKNKAKTIHMNKKKNQSKKKRTHKSESVLFGAMQCMLRRCRVYSRRPLICCYNFFSFVFSFYFGWILFISFLICTSRIRLKILLSNDFVVYAIYSPIHCFTLFGNHCLILTMHSASLCAQAFDSSPF